MKTEDYRSRLDVGSDMDSAKLHEIQEDLIFLAEKFAKINFQTLMLLGNSLFDSP